AVLAKEVALNRSGVEASAGGVACCSPVSEGCCCCDGTGEGSAVTLCGGMMYISDGWGQVAHSFLKREDRIPSPAQAGCAKRLEERAIEARPRRFFQRFISILPLTT